MYISFSYQTKLLEVEWERTSVIWSSCTEMLFLFNSYKELFLNPCIMNCLVDQGTEKRKWFNLQHLLKNINKDQNTWCNCLFPNCKPRWLLLYVEIYPNLAGSALHWGSFNFAHRCTHSPATDWLRDPSRPASHLWLARRQKMWF